MDNLNKDLVGELNRRLPLEPILRLRACSRRCNKLFWEAIDRWDRWHHQGCDPECELTQEQIGRIRLSRLPMDRLPLDVLRPIYWQTDHQSFLTLAHSSKAMRYAAREAITPWNRLPQAEAGVLLQSVDPKTITRMQLVLMGPQSVWNPAVGPSIAQFPGALLFAARGGSYSVCESLILSGVSVDQINEEGKSALHFAAANGHAEVARLLYAHGGSLSCPDRSKSTPLSLAVSGAHWNVVEALFSLEEAKKALRDPACIRLKHPLELAFDRGEYSQLFWMLQLLGDDKIIRMNMLAALGENDIQPEEREPSLPDLIGRDPQFALWLVDPRSRYAAKADGLPPLHWAAREGQVALLKVMLSSGAKMAARDLHGRSPIEVAITHNQSAAVKLFIESGYRVNLQDLEAAFSIDRDRYPTSNVLDVILKSGVDISSPEISKMIIKKLLNSGQRMAIKVCCEHGLDASVVDDDGIPILHRIVDSGLVDALFLWPKETLGIKDCRGRNLLFKVIEQQLPQFFLSYLLGIGLDPNAPDLEGNTPVHIAAARGHDHYVKQLLPLGRVASDSLDSQGRPPILLAALNGHAGVIRLFHKWGHRASSQQVMAELEPALDDRNGERVWFLLSTLRQPDELPDELIERIYATAKEPHGSDVQREAWYSFCRHKLVSCIEKREWKRAEPLYRIIGNQSDTTGYSLLYRFVERENEAAVAWLMAKGVDPFARQPNGSTPAHQAVTLGNLKLTQELARGCWEIRSDGNGNTLLHLAIRHHRHKILDYLLENEFACRYVAHHCRGPTLHDVAIEVRNGYAINRLQPPAPVAPVPVPAASRDGDVPLGCVALLAFATLLLAYAYRKDIKSLLSRVTFSPGTRPGV